MSQKPHQAAWYIKNRDRLLAKRKLYYIENKDAVLQKNKEWSEKNREASRKIKEKYRVKTLVRDRQKDYARTRVQNAVKKGVLIRPGACSDCGRLCKPEGHHHKGYSKEYRLDVIWLCKKCHAKHK